MDVATGSGSQIPMMETQLSHTVSRLSIESSDVEAHLLQRETQSNDDIELLTSTPIAAEYAVPTRTKLFHLAAYLLLNLTLTIYNKALLRGFSFPWLMTVVHCTTVSIGCCGLYLSGYFPISKLGVRENVILVAFSLLFTLNIAVSNVSLSMVSVPLHQTLRSTTPAFTVAIYRVLFGRTYTNATYISLIPVIFGAALAAYGDFSHTTAGLLMTILGVALGATKSITTNRIMTGSLKLSALETLLRMSPLAAVQSLLFSHITGEAAHFRTFVAEGNLTRFFVIAVIGNGLVAFVLNVSSLHTNKLAGALTMNISGNVKQCSTILLSIVLFGVQVTFTNGLGMAITTIGAAVYGKVELDSKGKGRITSST